MANHRIYLLLSCCLLCFALFIPRAFAGTIPEKLKPLAISTSDILRDIQTLPLVKRFNEHKLAVADNVSDFTTKLFSILFPGSPAVNSILATAYISGPPNFLLALCPPNIDPSSLSVMIAFAFGGLMGDTLFHLLPEIFLGEDERDHMTFVVIEPNKNLLLGVAILVGFVTFVILDKSLRIATGGEAHEHSHSHSESSKRNGEGKDSSVAVKATGVSSSSGESRAVARKAGAAAVKQEKPTTNEAAPSSGITAQAYLPLLADFTHNITDGLALSSSFYSSPTLGATTTLAVFFHEIPHEVGDFALLIQSGFSKRQAMGAQFVTAIGAFLGTFIGIFVQEIGGRGTTSGLPAISGQSSAGIFGTSLQPGDLLLPFTAGTFLYVGTVAVVPELLETGANKQNEVKKFLTQLLAAAAGAGIMLIISWS